jgi:DnaJ-class molecular chaperone
MRWKKTHPDEAPEPGRRECEHCSGTGCDPEDLQSLDCYADEMRDCPVCEGTGEVED